MMHRWLVTVFLLLPLAAAASEFSIIQPEKSGIAFGSRRMGAPGEGRFGRFTARVAFDPARPETGRAQIDVDLSSIEAGSADANEEVKSKAWFNTREFPTAKFIGASIKPLGGNRYETTGKMTIKGRTRDVVAPFTARIVGNAVVLDGNIPIQRLQYGIGEGAWSDTSTVADEVQVRFHFTLSASPATSSPNDKNSPAGTKPAGTAPQLPRK